MSSQLCLNPLSSRRLFVGQLPRTWTDHELKQLFEVYGVIVEANVITDKISGISKGCGFVTFAHDYSVICAQEQLHGKRILEGMTYPMYVRPADIGGINGMIGKLTTKEDLIQIFSRFGEIEDVTLLKTPDGVPKSCAFVKFYRRDDANRAVIETNGKFMLKGSNAPIVVKVAESEQEKILKKFQSAVWSITKLVENLNVKDKIRPEQPYAFTNNGSAGHTMAEKNTKFLITDNREESREFSLLTKELLKSLNISSDGIAKRRGFEMNML